jgi:hypothetical protein
LFCEIPCKNFVFWLENTKSLKPNSELIN